MSTKTDGPSVDTILRGTGLLTLGESPSTEALETSLRRLAMVADGADPLRSAALREGAVRALADAKVRAPARMVDAALNGAPANAPETSGPGNRLALSDPEPWPESVDGAPLLRELVETLVRFAALPEGAATALALWTLHAHAHDYTAVSPLLALTSPSKRCGKTTVLHVLGALVPRPLPASNITPAALFRAVEAFRPTLLVDEADTFLREREELRGVLNSGHTRASAVVVRAVASGDDYDARAFSTWAPKAVALIDSGTTLPDTIRDRSVEVRMRRRAPGEEVERLRLDRLDELEPIRRRCARWTSDQEDRIRALDPDVPSELHDRARDNWRPLVALADVAGGPWPERARRAALVLSTGREDDEASAAVLLLADLRDLFENRGADELASRDIVAALGEMEERPWPEWRRGDPLTARQLARLLSPFAISPRRIRTPDGRQRRGYGRDAFKDAWNRYLTPPLPSEGGSHPSQCHKTQAAAENAESLSVTDPPDVTDTKTPQSPGVTRGVTGVTDGEGGPAEGGVGPEVPDLLEGLQGGDR